MRTVSFVDRIDFTFEGNVMNKALTIGDVDNDNNNEIAIGNMSGDLFIFKNIQEPKPWAKASELGMIACLEVGDLTNQGLNCLISLSTEGWCHIFYLTPDCALCPTVFTEGDVGFDVTEFVPDNSQADCFNLSAGDERCLQQSAVNLSHNPVQQLNFNQPQSQPVPLILKPAYIQKLSSNAKACVIADIDGDGNNELIVSYTDRVVRSFRWEPAQPLNASAVDHSMLASTNFCFGALVIHEKWKLAGQVGSMSALKTQSGRSTVLVSQPGGSYVELICSGEELTTSDSINNESSNKPCCGPSVRYHPLGSPRARNPNVSTEVISDIVSRTRAGSDEESDNISFSAICTLDGTITLIGGDKIIWSLCVDHQLFAITKLDVTGDGTEEVVVCSWDGQTYIVNLSKEVVRFQFKENVAAFCSGTFSISKDHPSSVLCYATLSGKLVVFYNVHLNTIGITNMLDAVRSKTSIVKELRDQGIDTDNKDQLKEFINKVMYEPIRKL